MTIRENLVAQTGGALAKRRKRVNLKKWNVARGFMMERTKLTELRKTNTGNVIFKYVTSSLVYTKDNRATLMKCIKPAVMAAEIAAAMKTQAEATAKEMADEAAAEAATKGKGKGPPKQQTVLYSPDSEPMCLTDSCEDYSTLEIFFKAIFAPNPLNFDEETLEDLTIVEARAKAAAEALAVKADAKAIEAARAARAAASAADSDSEGEDEPKDHAHLFLPNMDPSNPHHHAHKRGSHHKLHGPGILEEGGQGSAFSSGRSVKRSSVDSRAASGRSALSSRTNKSGVSGRSARSSRSGASARSTKSANVAARTAAMAGIAATTAAEKAIKAKEEVESMLHHDGIPAPRVAEDALSTNLDILDVELPALVIRCEFSRNLPGKFPIAMTIIERLAAEERLADVFEILKTKKGFAGTYYSFTPDTKHQTIGPVLQGNLESRGLMLNADVLSDNVARYPSVANDFPAGRGVYVAENNSQFVVWVGEVDQIKIITQKKGKEADEIYELGRSVLNEMTAILREMPPPPEPEPKPEKKPKKRRSSVSSVASPDGGILSRQKSGMDGKREPSSIRSKSGMGTRAKSAVGIDGQTRSPGASLRKIGSKEPSHLGDGGLGDLHSMLNSAGSRRSQARSARSARSVMSIVSVEKSVKAQQTPSNPLNPSNETSGWAWDPQFGFLTVDPAGAGAGFDCSAMMVFRANRSRDQIAGYCYKAGVRVNVAPNRVKEANSRSIRIEPRRFYGQSDRAVIGGLFSGIRLLRKMMVIGPKGGGKKGNLRR